MAGHLCGFKTHMTPCVGQRDNTCWTTKSAPRTGSKRKANPVVIKSGLCYVLNFKCIKSVTENILSLKGCFSKGKFLLGATTRGQKWGRKGSEHPNLEKLFFRRSFREVLMEVRTLEHFYTKLSNFFTHFISL